MGEVDMNAQPVANALFPSFSAVGADCGKAAQQD
jgi:hypothetical protein